jgi:hypothetical protein
MDDAAEWLTLFFGGVEKLVKRGAVSQITLNKINIGRKHIVMAVGKIVDDDHLMAVANQ